ncbi:hypothetical protein D6777_04225, partial [Candidatus Woesearchaeota archaeon]
TLTEEYMQVPLFRHYLDNIREVYSGSRDKHGNIIEFNRPEDYFSLVDSWCEEENNGVAYVTQILTDIRRGVFPDLTNEDLQEFGKQVKLAPGMPEFFEKLKKKWEGKCDIKFYIVSVGLDAIIRGSSVAKHVDGIFATKLVSRMYDLGLSDKPVLDGMANVLAPFTKSQSVIEIAKGGRKNIDKLLKDQDYVYDYRNIITIGDGLSDVSQFAYLRNKGSTTICVYKKGDINAYDKIDGNRKVRDRVSALLARDYNEDSMLWHYINSSIYKILNRQCEFDQVVLNRFRKKKIKDEKLRETVAEHIESCLECNGLYGFFSERP